MRVNSYPLFAMALLALAGGLSGCTDDMTGDASLLPVQATAVDPDPSALRMARAAEQATASLNRLSQIEGFRTPMPNDAGMNFGSPALQQPVSLSWTGPIEQILRTLAEMGGFTLKTTGPTPPAPIVVSVNAYQQPVGAILRDVGLQAGRRADVVVDLGNQIISLRYAPTEGLLHY
ncbi:MAG TPA: DotD/TraH family lipoprotein [Alphaproteobacteria bacterium]|nr:DotD/TraH family lipoprotein [Alphaproteobacteria bacterium]